MPFLSAIIDKFRMNKTGIVNVRMVITEEKILSNIEKVQKMINPKSKKQIIQLEEDSYFKDLIDSIKTYLVEYPKKKNFPRSVYKACYDLVEFATNQFEENTKKIEELIIQREKNIALAYELKETLAIIKDKTEGWEKELENSSDKYSEDIAEALGIIANGAEEEKTVALKLVDARINNLESNFHIEIDMERIEDRSKALSYIGIEIAEALKYIPAPVEEFVPEETVQEVKAKAKEEAVQKAEVKEPAKVNPILATEPATKKEVKADKAEKVEKVETNKKEAVSPVENKVGQTVALKPDVKIAKEEPVLDTQYVEQTRFDVKPSLWQRFKNSKIIRTISYIMKIKVVLEFPALPEGRGEGI